MSPRIIGVLNRRLDRAFAEMECAWAEYKTARNASTLTRYTSTLRRADSLWKTLKTYTQA